MKLTKLMLAGAALVALSVPAMAGDWTDGKWYVGIGAGYNNPTDVSLPGSASVTNAGSTYTFSKARFSDSKFVDFTGGYAFTNNLRVEFEVSNTAPDLASVTVNDASVKLAGVHVRQWNFMANAFYDYPLTEKLAATAGAGIGIARTSLELNRSSVRSNPFTYQAVAGLIYHLTADVDTQIDYRYIGSNSVNYFGTDNAFDMTSHNIVLSLRFKL